MKWQMGFMFEAKDLEEAKKLQELIENVVQSNVDELRSFSEVTEVDVDLIESPPTPYKYQIRDGQLEPAGCFDDTVDAIIFKREHGDNGPVYLRRDGVKTKLFKVIDGDWFTLKEAKNLAKEHNLPYAIV